jgi:hypothetical protein
MTNYPNFPITQLAVDLSAEECWLAFSRYHPPILWGMPHPHLGKPANEIEAANQQAIHTLQARQLVERAEDQALKMDPWLDQIIQVCAQPEFSLFVQVWKKRDTTLRRHYLHFRSEQAVDQTTIGAGRYRFTALRDREGVRQHVERLLNLPNRESASAQEHILPEKTLLAVIEKCARNEPDAAAQELSAACLEIDTAQRLLAALSNATYKASLALLCTHIGARPWQVRGLSFVEGAGTLWMFKPAQRGAKIEVIALIPNPGSARQAVLGMLPDETQATEFS